MNTLRVIKIILWSLPIIVFCFLFSRYFVFSGVLSFRYDMWHDSPYVTMVPRDRVSEPLYDTDEKRWYRLLKQEPLYFDVRIPRSFDSSNITVEYKNGSQSIVEIAGVVDSHQESYIFQPLENRLLENLSWPAIREGELVLWQRKVEFKGITDFLAHLPQKREILLYRHDLGDGFDQFSPLVDIEASDKNYVLALYPFLMSAPETNSVRQREATFDTRLLHYGYHKYRFVLSAPRVNARENFRLYSVRFVMNREPITWNNFLSRSKNFFYKFF